MATDAPPVVAVHLGAQKTGSTWLHQLMQANADAHEAVGVRLVDRAEVRARITRPILDRKTRRPLRILAAARARRWLAAEGQAAARLVISDENMIGGITEVLRAGALYPSARRRMEALARLLGPRPVALFLGIRPQDRFSSSLTAEAMRIGSARRQSPQSIAERWWQNRPRWTPLVEDLLEAIPQATITVWDFDRLVACPAESVNALAGQPVDAPVTRRARFRREGLSARAIEELVKIRDDHGVDAARAAESDIRTRYPRGEDWPAFTLWDPNRAEALQQDYSEDLQRIAALGPRVHLVSAAEPH